MPRDTPSRAFEPRKRPRQARSRVTFDAILEAGARVLAERGYSATTTNEIAERAGVSIGSLYEYFPGKDAVFACLKEQLDAQTFDHVLGRVSDVDRAHPAAVLRGVLEARISAALERPALEALLREEIPASVFEERDRDVFRRFDLGMRGFVQSRAEDVRLTDLETCMELGVHVVELTVRHFAAVAPERLEDPAFVDAFADMMVRWILRDAPEDAPLR